MSCRRNSSLPQGYHDVLLYFPLEVSKYSFPSTHETTLIDNHDLHDAKFSGQFSVFILLTAVDASLLPEILSPLGFWDIALLGLFPCLTGFFVLVSFGGSSCCLTVEVSWASVLYSVPVVIQFCGFRYLHTDDCQTFCLPSSLSSHPYFIQLPIGHRISMSNLIWPRWNH